MSEARPQATPGSLVRPFLKLGTIAFGGPAAHVAMMEDTGPGPSDEDLRAVFKRFGRLTARPTAAARW